MRHTVYKLLWAWQYDKEEKWLNEMSSQGMALVSVGLFKYEFADDTPGKYTYRIELLDNLPSATKSKAYLQFLEETGAEHIASIFRWVYLRKKTEDGPFDLYSDIGSKIKYLKRLQIFFFSLMIINLCFGISNISIGASEGLSMNIANFALGILLLFLAVLFAAAVIKHTRKIRTLRRESQIRE